MTLASGVPQTDKETHIAQYFYQDNPPTTAS